MICKSCILRMPFMFYILIQKIKFYLLAPLASWIVKEFGSLYSSWFLLCYLLSKRHWNWVMACLSLLLELSSYSIDKIISVEGHLCFDSLVLVVERGEYLSTTGFWCCQHQEIGRRYYLSYSIFAGYSTFGYLLDLESPLRTN